MPGRLKRGITLIELLVVISIIIMLGAIVVPNMTPSVESRRLREATRSLDTFIAGAKARAVSNGRPVGVMLRIAASNNTSAISVVYAEVPETYAGEYYNSTMRVGITAVNNTEYTLAAEAPIDNFTTSGLVYAGDMVQFNGTGYFYRITAVSGSNLTLKVDTRGAPLPWPGPSPSGRSAYMPFQIFRQPTVYNASSIVGPSAASSQMFQFPPGTAIDLVGSVFPNVALNLTQGAPITILFSPSGGVTAIYANQTAQRFVPNGPVHLLVGKSKNMPAPSSGQTESNTNWLDPTNYYVSIGNLTGQITTTAVAPVDTSSATTLPLQLWQATAFTRDTIAVGGR